MKFRAAVFFMAVMLALPFSAADTAHAQEEASVQNENCVTMTLEEAIDFAMKNNLDLKSIQVDKKSTELSREMAQHSESKIKDGKKDISNAREDISQLESLARSLPEGVTLGQLSDNAKISELLKEHPEFSGLDKAALQNNVINPGKQAIATGEIKVDSGVQSINDSIKDKLDLSTSSYLSLNSATTVLTTMAQLQDEVTGCGYEVAKGKIALLVRNDYYEAIKAQKIENIKKAALERAKKQYEIARASYEEGIRAKDDFLLSQIQVNLFSVDYRKSQMERENAYTELKRVLNMEQDTKLSLVEDFTAEPAEAMALESGIKQGFEKRVDMKMSAAQYMVDKLNFEMTAKAYTENTYQYREAEIAMEKSAAQLQKKQIEVESEIRQSYQTMTSVWQMLSYTEGLEENARDALEIAQLRYEEGYGLETSGLKSSGLSDFAGTIVEVNAAQEKLAQVEEKVVEIIFSYNMARDKYLTDIGSY